MHKIIIFNPNAMILADFCLNRRPAIICCQIYNIGFGYENINIFLSTDHIWNCQILNSPFFQMQLDVNSSKSS